MTANAAYVITQALYRFGIIDTAETPTAADLAKCVPILSDLLRNEQADGAAQYLIKRVVAQLPAGVSGDIYSFVIGTANAAYLVQQDAVAVRAIWVNDINITVNRETRMAPIADVVRTTNPGIITKWHQERQLDNSILVTAWQPPRTSAPALIEYGGRVPLLSNPAGTDIVPLPSEGINDAVLLLGRSIMDGYGKVLAPNTPIVMDAERANKRWRDWARGQQWVRTVRA